MRRRGIIVAASAAVVAVALGIAITVHAMTLGAGESSDSSPPDSPPPSVAGLSTTLVVHLLDSQHRPLTAFDDTVVVSLQGFTPHGGFGIERYAAAQRQNCYKHRCSPGWVGSVHGGVATFTGLPSTQKFDIEATSGHSFLFHGRATFRVPHLATRNVRYTVTEGASVAGQVRSRDGAPMRGVVVGAVDSTGHVRHRSTTKADGSYRIVGLTSGAYRILFNAKAFDGTAPLIGFTPGYLGAAGADVSGYDGAEPVVVHQSSRTSDATHLAGEDAVLTPGATTTVHVTLPPVAAAEPSLLYFTAAHASDSQSVRLAPGLTVTVRLAVGTYHLVTYGPPARGQDGDDDTAYWFGGDGSALVKTRAESVLLVVDGSGDQTIDFGAAR